MGPAGTARVRPSTEAARKRYHRRGQVAAEVLGLVDAVKGDGGGGRSGDPMKAGLAPIRTVISPLADPKISRLLHHSATSSPSPTFPASPAILPQSRYLDSCTSRSIAATCVLFELVIKISGFNDEL